MAVRGLLVNEAGAVLVLRPRMRTADDDRWYRLPGGLVAEGELLHDSLVRHIREQTGLPLNPKAARIRAADWTPASPHGPAGTTHLYSFTAAVPAAFTVVPSDAFDHATWATVTDLDRLCAPSQAPQVKAALKAVRDNTFIELRADGRISP
ncbi:NUDIX domain-containing protein [Streptomyces sp. NPDC057654]|uniref:NUDIX domain-containing protein n=1 Tax=Streptomyces sp. NPDC057654 TaxID=3346196 RepID=UPI003698667C